MTEKNIEIKKSEAVPRGLLVVALWVIILWGAYAARNCLIPLSLAALLAFMTAPLVRWLGRHKVPEWLGIFISALVLVLPFLSIGVILVNQSTSLVQNSPAIIAGLENMMKKVSEMPWIQKMGLDQMLTLPSLSKHLGQSAGEGMNFILHGVRAVFEMGTEATLILIFAILMLISREHIARASEKILSQIETVHAAGLMEAVTKLIEKFLISKVIVVGIVGAIAVATLQICGLQYGFLLGAILGVLTLIPEVGFVVSLIPITIVSVATGNSAIMTTIIVSLMIVIHLIEANILTPKLVGSKLNLNALATFIGLFAGGLLWGVWGMLLSVPILGVARIVLNISPSLQPWSELMAEREDGNSTMNLIKRRARKVPPAVNPEANS